VHAHVCRQILEANSTLERLAQEISELREINDQVRVALETTRKQASDFQQYVRERDRTTPLPSPLGCLWRPHAVLSEAQFFSLIHRSHSISFTRAQGIPKYKIGFRREKDGRVGRDWLRGVGVTVPPNCETERA
jgi:hypothetical protein